MFFLLRMAICLGIVLMLLPSGGSEHGAPHREITATDAVSAAAEAAHDLRGFCTRERDACTVGAELAAAMARRAQAGARMLYGLATGAAVRHSGAGPDPASESRSRRESTPPATDAAPAGRGRSL